MKYVSRLGHNGFKVILSANLATNSANDLFKIRKRKKKKAMMIVFIWLKLIVVHMGEERRSSFLLEMANKRNSLLYNSTKKCSTRD